MQSENRNPIFSRSRFAVFGLVLLLGLLLLWRSASTAKRRGPTTTAPSPQATAAATSIWNALLEMTPVAYTTPYPDPVESPLEGIFAKVDLSWPQWWLCRRCADYRPAGGLWKLQFDRGVMRIYYEVTGWRSLASFTVTRDRLYLFNDVYCAEVGEYTWHLEDESLKLEVVNDACSFQLRGRNLSHQPWAACQPPDAATRTNDYGPISVGCEIDPSVAPTAIPANLPVVAAVHGGDSRFFKKPPDVFALANSADSPAPDGIRITYSEESIPYGLSRILWWKGEWIQASTDLQFASMGVQFLGDPPIGWARVLFDGQEVWRGNTSAIWSHHGRHGGYIEISAFGPGRHTIRAESLRFDYHPVTVASFGFSFQSGVESGEP